MPGNGTSVLAASVSGSGMNDSVRIVLALASLTGMAISGFFLLVMSGRMNPESAVLPAFCRIDRGTCGRVIGHRDARFFGVPNAVPGIAFFLLVLLHAAFAPGSPFAEAVRFASWLASAISVMLLISLAMRVRARCTLCLISHGLTFLISLVLTFGS